MHIKWIACVDHSRIQYHFDTKPITKEIQMFVLCVYVRVFFSGFALFYLFIHFMHREYGASSFAWRDTKKRRAKKLGNICVNTYIQHKKSQKFAQANGALKINETTIEYQTIKHFRTAKVCSFWSQKTKRKGNEYKRDVEKIRER